MSRAEADKEEIAHACMRAISELDGFIGQMPAIERPRSGGEICPADTGSQ